MYTPPKMNYIPIPNSSDAIRGLQASGQSFNAGFDALNSMIRQQEGRYKAGITKETNQNDLAIQANLEKFKNLDALNQAQEAGQFGIDARQGLYGDKYSQAKAKAAYGAQKDLLSGRMVDDRITQSLDSAWKNQGMNSDIQNASVNGLSLDLRNQVNKGRTSAWNNRTQLTDKQTQRVQDKTKLDEFERQGRNQELSSNVNRYQTALSNMPGLGAEEVNWGVAKKGDLNSVINTIQNDPDGSWMRSFGRGASGKELTKFKQELVTTLGGDENLASAAMMQAYSDAREVNRTAGILGGGTYVDEAELRKNAGKYVKQWKDRDKLQGLLADAQNTRSSEMLKFNTRKMKEQSGMRDTFTFGKPKNVDALEQRAQAAMPAQTNPQEARAALMDRISVQNLKPTNPQQQGSPVQDRLASMQRVVDRRSPVQGRLNDMKSTNPEQAYPSPAATGRVPSPSELRNLDTLRERGREAQPQDELGSVTMPVPANNTQSNITIKAGTLADKNNNPGNLRLAGQAGATKGQGGFAKFNSPKEGYNALVKDLKIKQSGKSRTGLTKDSTLEELINVYAPSSENDTNQYVSDISKWLKLPASTSIADMDMESLAKAIARKESGTTVK